MFCLNEMLYCYSIMCLRCGGAPVCLRVCVCVYLRVCFALLRVCSSALSTCDILRVHSLPLGRESAVCEATVRLEGHRYRVTGADHHWGKDVATVCTWISERKDRGKREGMRE